MKNFRKKVMKKSWSNVMKKKLWKNKLRKIHVKKYKDKIKKEKIKEGKIVKIIYWRINNEEFENDYEGFGFPTVATKNQIEPNWLWFVSFLDASSHLYMRVGPSICWSVRPSVRWSVRDPFVKNGKINDFDRK